MPGQDILVKKAMKTISRYEMLAAGDRVLVSLSGGPDSLALLLLLSENADALGISLEVFHLDHMIRGEESRQDALFVEGLCEDIGIPCHSRRFDVPAYTRERSLSPQEGARELRNSMAKDCADAICADRIAIGHTADDQVETLLMRLIQGAGLSGLSAIPPVSGRIVRPLVMVWRDEIEEFCRSRRVEPRRDSSNLETHYLRNRVRLVLIPLLERQFGPGVKGVLLREVESLRRDGSFLDESASRVAEGILGQDHQDVFVDREGLTQQPRALQSRILQMAWKRVNPGSKPLRYQHLQDIMDKVAGGLSGSRMDLPGGLEVRREYDRLIFAISEGGARVYPHQVELVVPGTVSIPWTEMEIGAEAVDAVPDAFNPNPLVEYVSLPGEGRLLVIRPVIPGDRFRPLGAAGSKKVKDYFIDHKVPRPERKRAAVVTCGGEIVWLVGHRLDQRFAVSEGAGRVVRMEARIAGYESGRRGEVNKDL